jgi:hypothetical protein
VFRSESPEVSELRASTFDSRIGYLIRRNDSEAFVGRRELVGAITRRVLVGAPLE